MSVRNDSKRDGRRNRVYPKLTVSKVDLMNLLECQEVPMVAEAMFNEESWRSVKLETSNAEPQKILDPRAMAGQRLFALASQCKVRQPPCFYYYPLT